MRKRLRTAVAGSVILLLLAIGLLVGRSLWQQRQQDWVPNQLELIPGVSQHIRDFHRVKVQEGRKVWEVSAQDAQYVDEDKTVVVRDATMELFLKDGRVVGLSGEEGRIVLDGREVARVELNGNIEVRLADYTVRTARATYDQRRQVISAPGRVEISGHDVQLQGDRMEVQVDTQRVNLRQHVTMQLRPAPEKRGGSNAPL